MIDSYDIIPILLITMEFWPALFPIWVSWPLLRQSGGPPLLKSHNTDADKA